MIIETDSNDHASLPRGGATGFEPGRHVVISGCSGGGKSALLAELARRGYPTVAEPGRRIVIEELAQGGRALPWVDLAAFARRAVEMAIDDRRDRGSLPGWVFFARGLIDAAAALRHATGRSVPDIVGACERYHRQVFMAPPWPEIFVSDDERRHGLSDAVQEYDRLLVAYRRLAYDVIILPKTGVEARADFLLRHLQAQVLIPPSQS